jgi:hypothetical protein
MPETSEAIVLFAIASVVLTSDIFSETDRIFTLAARTGTKCAVCFLTRLSGY